MSKLMLQPPKKPGRQGQRGIKTPATGCPAMPRGRTARRDGANKKTPLRQPQADIGPPATPTGARLGKTVAG